MFTRRFALGIVFVVLAMAGEAGAALESMPHEGERCLICEGAARPAAKTLSIHNSGVLKRLIAEQQLTQKNLSENIASSARSYLNNPSVSRFRILLI
jgi:hypothetical protein